MSLDNIMTKADLNVLSDEIKKYVSDRVGGGYTDYTKLLNKPDLSKYALISNVPTKVSDLTNDSGYITDAGVISVKGNHESSYRTGNVNLTSDNVESVRKLFDLRTAVGSSSYATNVKSYFLNSINNNSVEIGYNDAGGEYTLIFSRGGSNAYGTVLRASYATKYIEMLRRHPNGGHDGWYSEDWEKMDAGYADRAGNVPWNGLTGMRSIHYDDSEDFVDYAWHRVATATIGGSYEDRVAHWFVSIGYGHGAFATGILSIRLRSQANNTLQALELAWQYKTNDTLMPIENFVTTFDNNSKTATLWCKIPERFSGYKFTMLENGYRTTVGQYGWTMLDSTSGHGETNYSGDVVVQSVVRDLTNTSAKAILDYAGNRIDTTYVKKSGDTMSGDLVTSGSFYQFSDIKKNAVKPIKAVMNNNSSNEWVKLFSVNYNTWNVLEIELITYHGYIGIVRSTIHFRFAGGTTNGFSAGESWIRKIGTYDIRVVQDNTTTASVWIQRAGNDSRIGYEIIAVSDENKLFYNGETFMSARWDFPTTLTSQATAPTNVVAVYQPIYDTGGMVYGPLTLNTSGSVASGDTKAVTGGAVYDYLSTNFDVASLSVRVKPTYNADKFISKTWNGKTDIRGNDIWTDGKNIYYSYKAWGNTSTKQYVLNKSTSTWVEKTWNGITIFEGRGIWTDGENIYYNYYDSRFEYTASCVLNKATSTWSTKTWNGLANFDSSRIWTDGENIYHGHAYVLNVSTSTWSTKTWNGLADFDSVYIWTDGENIYYSKEEVNYVLNRSTSTWVAKTWNGLDEEYGELYGNHIFTYKGNIYYSYYNSYMLDKATSTWIPKTWNGLSSFNGDCVWSDGTNLYYSDGTGEQYVLSDSTYGKVKC